MSDQAPVSYDFGAIEARWQQHWQDDHTFAAPNPGDEGFDPAKPKYYVLDMFPYPSGVGLHVGHPLGYIATDIIARYRRMTGHNVLHPMGYDAFGLPAEQFAVEHGVHPRVTTEQNIANMTRQLKMLGLSYDWDRCIATTDVGYYKWTQWIFLQLYHSFYDTAAHRARPIADLQRALANEQLYVNVHGELVDNPGGGLQGIEGDPIGVRKWHELNADEQRDILDSHRLAYLAEVPVNWCPALGTVLANEEVTNEGRSERGNHPVFKRPLKQWMLRITAFAERLENDLELVDWPDAIKLMQRNWIGRSTGAQVDFAVGDDVIITVFTTRPDTLFGATYMVLAPEHPLVDELTTDAQRAAVESYRTEAARKSDVDRQAETKRKTGVFIGAYATNPVNDEPIPIWIADYVMMGYGTGAIMAVPAHDDRDFEFATQFGLPIRDVVYDQPLAAIAAFARHYVETGLDDEAQGRRMLTDFLGLCGNQNRDDYDIVWNMIQIRRDEEAQKDEFTGRGTVANIWADALPANMAEDFAALMRAGAEGGLVKLLGTALTEPGVAANSANDDVSLDGLPTADAKRVITEWLEDKALGKATVQYKLRDWLFSRQRYWGEPFPILHGPDGEVRAVDERDLPVELPEMEDFRPHATDDPNAPPQPPLSRAPNGWKYVEIDGVRYTRELNTMPQWAGSCWYYLRFLDPHNDERFVERETEQYWMVSEKKSKSKVQGPKSKVTEGDGRAKTLDFGPWTLDRHHAGGVDLYVGGAEHAVLHLLYARFWHKVLFDLGHVSTPEPFGRLFNQGYIQAYAYTDERGVYIEAGEVTTADGRPAAEAQGQKGQAFVHDGKPVIERYGKMGKSLKNAVTPDEICEQYGADTLRLYEMYLGPLDQSKPWNTRDIIGVHRFLQRLWRNLVDEDTGALLISDEQPDDGLRRRMHQTIARVTEAMDRLQFNIAIAALIELNNELVSMDRVPRAVAETVVLLLAPMAPHMAEELWSKLGHEQTLAYADWPRHDPALLIEAHVEVPVQIMGKVRARITVPADADEKALEAAALADERVKELLVDKTVRKVIVVPGKLVNIVAS